MAHITLTNQDGYIKYVDSGATGQAQYIPKQNLSIKVDSDNLSVSLRWVAAYLGGSNHLGILYTDVTSPSYASAAAMALQLASWAGEGTSSGSSSASGGGASTYSNAYGDFTAVANNGASTITITGLPYILEEKHVIGGGLIYKKTTAGIVTTVDLDAVVVLSGVITLAQEDNFVTTDEVIVFLAGPDKAYDRSLDTSKVTVQNGEWSHYTDIEHILDESNDTVAQHYSPEIFADGYRNLAIQLTANATGATGVTFKIWLTLNTAAATPADLDASPSTDWTDKTTEIFGGATTLGGTATETDVFFIDTNTMPYKYIIQYDPTHATNTTDIFIRKY